MSAIILRFANDGRRDHVLSSAEPGSTVVENVEIQTIAGGVVANGGSIVFPPLPPAAIELGDCAAGDIRDAGRQCTPDHIAEALLIVARPLARRLVRRVLDVFAEGYGVPAPITDRAAAMFSKSIAAQAVVVDLPRGDVCDALVTAMLESQAHRKLCLELRIRRELGQIVDVGDADDVEPEPEAPASDDDLDDVGSIEIPGAVGAIKDWILACSDQPAPPLALGAALTFVGALAGRLYASPTDLRTNIYALGMAPTGVGKDVARKCIKSLVSKALPSGRMLGNEIKSGAGLRDEVKDNPAISVSN